MSTTTTLPGRVRGESLRLDVGDGHELHVETRGRTGAPAAVYLHGGPGSGCQPMHHRLFDPDRWFAVFPDQRGAGRSTPHGSREANTTAHLVADLEAIRERLEIGRWLVVGGSWGATLGLAYAQAHPERVSGLVLRAVFLGTRAELDWAFRAGLERFRPELNRQFLSALDQSERQAPLDAYWRRILGADPSRQRVAAWAWHDVERVLSELAPAATLAAAEHWADPARALPATALMEAHYFSQDCFLAPDQLMADAGRLAGVPGIVVQGRYDMLCPPSSSAALCNAWPDAQLRMVEAAGHSLGEPGVFDAVSGAIAEFRGRPGRSIAP